MRTTKIIIKGITLHRVNNGVDGNSRYVCHFLNFDTDYNKAHQKALELGGKKYRAKWYGGGFVFQTSSPERLVNFIINLNDQSNENKQ